MAPSRTRSGLPRAPRISIRRRHRLALLRIGLALPSLVVALAWPGPSRAFEALDGRLQAHGFFESQMRYLNADYSEDWDMSQWYQVFNLEVELELIQDTLGPVDLVSAFVRAEARYDCVYSRGCGLFRSVNAYGDRAKSLPRRLNNAHGRLAAGAIVIDPDTGRLSGGSTDPVPLEKVEGFFQWSRQPGADGEFRGTRTLSVTTNEGTFETESLFDDPYPYVFERFQDFRFTQIQGRGGGTNGLPVRRLGPWLPGNFIFENAGLADRVNPMDDTRRSPVLFAASFNSAFEESLSPTAGDVEGSLAVATRNTGSGARPFRPVPASREGKYARNNGRARGMYIQSQPLNRLTKSGRVDAFTRNLNFREAEREWNRGASQQDEKELKEAYLDIEMFDSRLWMRIGKQTIVWGKTELFRTTDQFNPQDIGLASLPSLEESRIALWAFRGTWSFYEVGPFEDVRLEAAFNFDQYEPTDVGACGEAYTVDLVCEGAFGAFAHGVTGIGLAGARFPADPWDDLDGWEAGVRLEWRWDRFSFAVSNFYGYSDIPYVERISTYERNVDPKSGRPRFFSGRGACKRGDEPGCLLPGPTTARKTAAPGEFDSMSENRVKNPRFTQEDAYGYVPREQFLNDRGALGAHHANQQIFAVICSTTIGVLSLDPTACAQTAFTSRREILGAFTVSQLVSAALAGGERAMESIGAQLSTRDPFDLRPYAVRLSKDNQQFGQRRGDLANRSSPGRGGLPISERRCFDDNLTRDGTGVPCGGVPEGVAGTSNVFAFFGEALAQVLTPQQEAMVGCGPFWGTNCDESGIDLMNAEASALLQSFAGWEGTVDGWRTDGSLEDVDDVGLARLIELGNVTTDPNGRPITRQPGTVGYRGGPICTVGFLGNPGRGGNKRLPGCRGLRRNGTFQPGYNVFKDGDVVNMNDQPNPFRDSSVEGIVRDGSNRHPFTDQPWQNELAGMSWNFLLFTVLADDGDPEGLIEGFDPDEPLSTTRCSLLKPQLCENVQGLLRLSGITRPDVKSGGNGRFGRRSFQWHNGGELMIRFEKRNVLGFAMDWAVDSLKANFSVEATWIEGLPRGNTESFDGLIEVDEYNLTISADRPTFINFLNPNRTFFINTQWFFQYVEGWKFGTRGTGPWNVLGTLAISTGYFQDRLLPTLAFVYDVQSVSGAALPEITYRYNDSFSITVGAAMFMGRRELVSQSVNPVALTNRVDRGQDRHKDQEENGLSVLRNRDEVFLRLRYTF